MKDLSVNPGPDATPAVVWLYTPADEKALTALNSTVFQNERVGIAMKKFRCLRVNVEEIDNREIREEYLRTAPSFIFFDPAGGPLAELSGKRATSLSNFSSALEKVWNQSFTVSLKSYTTDVTGVLNELDKINSKVQILEQNQARIKAKPNARKQRKLKAEAEALRAEKEAVLEKEQEILAGVELRPEFRPEEQAVLDR